MFIPDIRKGVNIRLIHSEFKLSTYDYEKRYLGGVIKSIGIGLLFYWLSLLKDCWHYIHRNDIAVVKKKSVQKKMREG